MIEFTYDMIPCAHGSEGFQAIALRRVKESNSHEKI
jgi:hypothetical protein